MSKESLQNLRTEVSKNLNVGLSLDCRETTARLTRDLQHFVKLRPEGVDHSQLELLLTHALSAEKICPGAGIKFLESFSIGKKQYSDREVRTKFDSFSVLEEQKFSPEVNSVLKEVLQYVTSKTRITLKKSRSTKIFIEMSEGYRFDVMRPIKTSDVELKNLNVCCIDGYVENISEIHHLLTYLAENKKDCLLFIRGAADDVLNTLKVNYDRQTLCVIPYILPYDLENVNTIVDIAIVSGTDVISSTKGQIISSIDINCLGSFESCYVSSNNIIAKNQKTSQRVKDHVKQLKEKAEKSEETQSLLLKRIESLSSSCIDINIPDDIRFLSLSSQFDKGIRIISSIINKSYMPNDVANRYYDLWTKQVQSCEQFLL